MAIQTVTHEHEEIGYFVWTQNVRRPMSSPRLLLPHWFSRTNKTTSSWSGKWWVKIYIKRNNKSIVFDCFTCICNSFKKKYYLVIIRQGNFNFQIDFISVSSAGTALATCSRRKWALPAIYVDMQNTVLCNMILLCSRESAPAEYETTYVDLEIY